MSIYELINKGMFLTKAMSSLLQGHNGLDGRKGDAGAPGTKVKLNYYNAYYMFILFEVEEPHRAESPFSSLCLVKFPTDSGSS